MTDRTTSQRFNEESLYKDIVGRWGEHGAHAQVFRMLWSSHGALQTTVLHMGDALTKLEAITEDLRSTFQEVTDYGDSCPLCYSIFKASGQAVPCIGHAAVIDLEARRG